MKLVSLCAVGVAGLALQASAAPLRVITLIPLPDALAPMHPVPPFHVGYAGAFAGAQYHDPARAEKHHDEEERFWTWLKQRPGAMAPEAGRVRMHGGCHRKSFAHKLNRLMNNFWTALGFPQDDKVDRSMAEHHGHHKEAHHHWAPFRPGAQVTEAEAGKAEGGVHFVPILDADGKVPTPDSRWPMPFHHPGHHQRFHNHRDWHHRPFHRRVMHALFILGPVEGRIVAFVLGLGIGALIRVVYVLGLLAYRSMSGKTHGRIMLVEGDEEPLLEHVGSEVREKAPEYSAEARPGEQTVVPAAVGASN